MILGASFDTAAENKAFKDKFEFPFPLLTASKAMGVAYGAADDESAAMPKRAACVVAPDGTVHRWWANVDARTFPESVLQELP